MTNPLLVDQFLAAIGARADYSFIALFADVSCRRVSLFRALKSEDNLVRLYLFDYELLAVDETVYPADDICRPGYRIDYY